KDIGVASGEFADLVQHFNKGFLVVRLGANLLSDTLTLAEPSGCGHGIGFEGGGFAIADFGGGSEGLPFLDAGDAEEIKKGPKLIGWRITSRKPMAVDKVLQGKLFEPGGIGRKPALLLKPGKGGLVITL